MHTTRTLYCTCGVLLTVRLYLRYTDADGEQHHRWRVTHTDDGSRPHAHVEEGHLPTVWRE